MMSRILSVDKTEIGMIIDKPIYRNNGVLLIPSDTVITTRVKQLLTEYYIEYVEVQENQVPLMDTSKSVIKETKAFKTFNKEILSATEHLKDSLSSLVSEDNGINVQKLGEQVFSLFNTAETTIQLLDMMYCMRDYDDLTYTHSVNVALMCQIMGEWLKLSSEDKKVLVLCGLLHDVGKMDIPQSIMTKQGKLTEDEMNIIKEHPVKSYNILENQDLDDRIKETAYMHHEKCDGSGYPKGLKGNEISEFAKIVTIIDVYDAMTADRVYRKGLCPFKVVETLIAEGYDKYDPKYLLLFLERITETYINKYVHLSNGLTGKIVLINKNDIAHPVIQIGEKYIDLSKNKNISIEVVL